MGGFEEGEAEFVAAKVGDSLLGVGGDEELDEGAGELGLDLEVLVGVDHDDVVGIEEAFIAFGEDHEVEVFAGKEGAPVGEDVGAEFVGGGEGAAHALAEGEIPVVRLDGLDAGLGPDLLFLDVGARLVAAGGEAGAGLGDASESLGAAGEAGDPGGVVGGAEDYEVVVHDVGAADAVAVFDELQFEGRGVDEDDVGVASGGDGKGLAGADGYNPDAGVALPFEGGDDVVQEPGVVGAGGGGEDEGALGALEAGGGCQQGCEQGRESQQR